MIHVVSRRSHSHPNFCEDAYHYERRNSWVIAAVFDGCSDGIRSHFASQLHAYAFRKTIDLIWPAQEQLIAKKFRAPDEALNDLSAVLVSQVKASTKAQGMNVLESLSTAVLALYNSQSKYLIVKFLGDGVLYVDGHYERITSGDRNAPDYIAYMEKDDPDPFEFVDRPTFVFPSASRWAICTDGIDAIRHPHKPLEECLSYLLEDAYLLSLDRMLRSKVSILEREGMVLSDDLTIIRYDSV